MSTAKPRNKALMLVRCFALVLLIMIAVQFLPVPAHARTLNEINADIKAKQAELESIENTINANIGNREVAEAALLDYQASYNQLLFLISEQNLLIDENNAVLDLKYDQLNNAIISAQQNKELFIERMRVIYEINSTSAMVGTLLNVSNLTEAVQVADIMQRVSQRDNELMQELARQREVYEQQKAELETAIAQMNADLADLEENRTWCVDKMNEMKVLIAQANINIELGEAQYEATEEEITALREEYAKIFRELQSRGSRYGDGSTRYDGPLVWPVNGHWRVSSYFGDARSNTRDHYGIDIPAPDGTPISACGDGVVITSEWHFSYGYYIVVDHGQGLRTLYAHCSQLNAAVGTPVTAGQTIALVGNTGDSYGSHLHLEVHEGGGRQNPLSANYLNPI